MVRFAMPSGPHGLFCKQQDRRRHCSTVPPLSWPCFLQAQRRNHFWELIEERENNPFDSDKEEVVTFELGEMLLMLLAAGGADKLTDS